MVNSREVSSQIDVPNWKIPKQKTETIYRIGKFDCNTTLSINVISTISQINFHKWYIPITLKIKDSFEYNTLALLDSGAGQNCIQEGLISSTYYEQTKERLHTTNGTALQVKYKLSNAYICNQGYCFKNSFILVRDMSQEVILGTSFLTQIYLNLKIHLINPKIHHLPLIMKIVISMN